MIPCAPLVLAMTAYNGVPDVFLAQSCTLFDMVIFSLI
ncbi:hypothetical protein L580_3435 [Serratia fonticola AU-P3(3)]|nr:hypothetical protein L580_3435 [Serratia fonticola AU-P3(3)]